MTELVLYPKSGCLPRMVFLIVGILWPVGNDCSRILLTPFPYKSHISQLAIIGSGLLEHGHDVHILLPQSYPELESLRSKFKVIDYKVKDPDIYSMTGTTSTDWLEATLKMSPIEELRTNVDGFIQFCTNPLEDEELVGRLSGFDLALVDGFACSRCYFILMHIIKLRFVSFLTTYEPWVVRSPALPSFVPFLLAGGDYSEKMSFVERLQNLLIFVDWTARTRIPYLEEEFVRRYLPKEPQVSYASLAAESQLWLIDTDVVIDYSRPAMPYEVNVGGLTTGPARQLTGELEEFSLGADQGLIVVSFGSNDFVNSELFERFIEAFSRLDQRVVWRYDREVPAKWLTKWPSNVKVMKWIPQNDLLGHKNTRLFVTHCGANSQFEALYHAVPMLGFPVFADQPYNARRMEYFGYGTFLKVTTFTSNELYSTIKSIVHNNTYYENIRLASETFRDRPETPMARAVWWVEHVLKHGGKHLHSHAKNLVWYEYFMLDILLLLVVAPAMIITALLTGCCLKIIHKCRRLDRKLITQNIKQD